MFQEGYLDVSCYCRLKVIILSLLDIKLTLLHFLNVLGHQKGYLVFPLNVLWKLKARSLPYIKAPF